MDLAGARWRRSSYSSGSGGYGDCVEVATAPLVTAVRDSKHPVARVTFPRVAWRVFLTHLR